MVDALFVDHGLSQWLYEQKTGMLFTADWGHNLHEPDCGQCFQFMDEMLGSANYSEALMIDDIKVNAWYQFPWLAWAEGERILAAIDELFAQYDVKILAPSHGNVIRYEAGQYVEHLKEGMRRAVDLPFSHVL